ncbi:MAG TPA: hypothetical protein VJ850_08495 [Candidatus Limnocylindrales bacterium]|nr:hypothetical protein [Candidatus Limnocylindrales bacterium]
MSTPILRWLLFLTSYAPLPIVVAVRTWLANPVLAMLWIALSIALAVEAWASFQLLRGSGSSDLVLEDVQPQREAFTTYLLGYVLPFVLIDLNDSSAVSGAVAFVFILGLAAVRSNLVYLNPLLALAGFRLYAVSARLVPGPERAINLLLLAKESHLGRGDRLLVGGEDPDVRIALSGPRR